jgi:hypothetical protein
MATRLTDTLSLIESYETDVRKTALTSREGLVQAIDGHFGIPTAIATLALDGLHAERDPRG